MREATFEVVSYSLGVLQSLRFATEKVPLNLIEVILAQGSIAHDRVVF